MSRQVKCKLCGFKIFLADAMAYIHNGAAPDVRFMKKWHNAKHRNDEGWESGGRGTRAGGPSKETVTEGIWINSHTTEMDDEQYNNGKHDPVDWDEEMEHPEFLYYLAEHDWYANHCYVSGHNSNREDFTEHPEKWADYECHIIDDWEHKKEMENSNTEGWTNRHALYKLPTLEEYLDLQRERTFGEYQRQEWGPFATKPELSKYIALIHTDEPHGRWKDIEYYKRNNRLPCDCELCIKRFGKVDPKYPNKRFV
tara:strand:+ start:754 stop:1515 length:762 start_codon:yes stop_codon:yes gene_type:complete